MLGNGDLILRYLEHLGVEYVFGVPGGSIEPFYDALARSERRGGIRAITARHNVVLPPPLGAETTTGTPWIPTPGSVSRCWWRCR